MGGFTGFESAAGEEVPKAWAVIDHFHVVSLAFSKLDQCRRRTQRAITCWRDQSGDRLYQPAAPCALGVGLLADTQVVPAFFDYPCAPAALSKRSTGSWCTCTASLWASAVSSATSFAALSTPDASKTA